MFKQYNKIFTMMTVISIIQTVTLVFLIALTLMFYKSSYTITTNNNTVQNVNVNTCSQDALESLSGVGATKATNIILNRPYSDIYELKRVVGDKTFKLIKDRVTVKGD